MRGGASVSVVDRAVWLIVMREAVPMSDPLLVLVLARMLY